MTLQEFIEKIKADAALRAKVHAAIMEKVILPMATAEGVELTDEELMGVSGGVYTKATVPEVDHVIRSRPYF